MHVPRTSVVRNLRCVGFFGRKTRKSCLRPVCDITFRTTDVRRTYVSVFRASFCTASASPKKSQRTHYPKDRPSGCDQWKCSGNCTGTASPLGIIRILVLHDNILFIKSVIAMNFQVTLKHQNICEIYMLTQPMEKTPLILHLLDNND